jgi:hypothetical protein
MERVNEEYQKLIDKLKEVRQANLMASDKSLLDEVMYSLTKLGSRPVLSDNVEQFMSITHNMAKTYAAKNHDYGNSFEQSLDKFGLVASVVRLGDKMNRIESLTKKEAQVKDESIKDTLLDMANYAIITVMWMDKKSGE